MPPELASSVPPEPVCSGPDEVPGARVSPISTIADLKSSPAAWSGPSAEPHSAKRRRLSSSRESSRCGGTGLGPEEGESSRMFWAVRTRTSASRRTARTRLASRNVESVGELFGHGSAILRSARARLIARRASCTVEAKSLPTSKASLARVSWAEIARESSRRASPLLVALQFMPMGCW